MSQIDFEKLDKTASKLRAIAHPMRIAIIDMLEVNKRMNVTAIHTTLKIEQATASHHLGILKEKGILESRRDGKKSFYTIKEGSLDKINECIKLCEE